MYPTSSQQTTFYPALFKLLFRNPFVYIRYLLYRYTILLRLFRKKTFTLTNNDLKLHKLIEARTHGYFVELGAFDGIVQSNTKYLEAFQNWTGLLIEPNPEKVNLCRLSRKKSTKVVQAACVPFGFGKNQVTFESLETMSFSKDFALDVADYDSHEASARSHLGSFVKRSFLAFTLPLGELLRSVNAPEYIDFLSLDVEGAELAVLQGINLQEFKIAFMLIESRNLQALASYLDLEGYRLKAKLTHSDYLFERR